VAKRKKLLHPLLKLLLLLLPQLLLLKHLPLLLLTQLLPPLMLLQPLLLKPPRPLLPSNWNQIKKATFGWFFFAQMSGRWVMAVCGCARPRFSTKPTVIIDPSFHP
jgi:hypothetical protein